MLFALFLHRNNRKRLEHRQREQILVILDTFSDFLKNITVFFKWQCVSEIENLQHRVNGLGYKLADNLHLKHIRAANTINAGAEFFSGENGVDNRVRNWLKIKHSRNQLDEWLNEIFDETNEKTKQITNLKELKKQILNIIALGNIFKNKISIKVFIPLGNDQVDERMIKSEKLALLPFLRWDENSHSFDLTWKKKLKEHKMFEVPLFMDVNRKKKTIEFIPLEKLPSNPNGIPLKADLDSPYIMSPKEPGMREKIPELSSKAATFAFFLVIITGIIWLLYLPIYGQNYTNVLSVIGFIIFYYAELINFALGLIYYINFFYPVTRRWKSFQHLPNNHLRPHVDCLIFHYSEEIEDTMDTIDGCLKLKTCNGQIKSNIYVCDDGFWDKLPPKEKQYLSRDVGNSCCSKKKSKPKYSLINEDGAVGKPLGVYRYPSSVSQNSVFEEEHFEENVYLECIREQFQVKISEKGRRMKREIKQLLLSHYDKVCAKIGKSNKSDPPKLKIKITTRFKLPKKFVEKQGKNLPQWVRDRYDHLPDSEKYLCRTDCSVASLSYCFSVFIGNETTDSLSFQKRQKIFIVARIKPPKHHFKAGNINNCLYNEIEHSNNRLIAFFDNDMRPEPPFLVRCVPFFYKQVNGGGYELDETVGYVQTPQYFTDDTLGPVLDYLSSKNSIFFQAIQKGRDGFDMSAFSGTNAIFRAGALFAIGGLPYGSQTEDALCGNFLHKNGYTSAYAEEVLTIGTAPETVASTMVQRMRWCKVGFFHFNFLAFTLFLLTLVF